MSSPPQLHILVVGASIAGPASAYWLSRIGPNVQITVIERFPALRRNGQNIDIRTVGVTVMRKIPGMEEAVLAKRYDIDQISMVDPNGNLVATIKQTGNPEQQSLISEYEILRGDLSEILVGLTKGNPRVKYIFGEQVSSLSEVQNGEKMRAEFLNGYPATEFDLVIAADGSTSRTRAMGLGCGARDHVISMNSWATYFWIDEDLSGGVPGGQAWTGVGGKFLAMDPGKQVAYQSLHPQTGKDVIPEFRAALKKGNDAVKELVARELEGEEDKWKLRDIVRCMMKAEEFYATELMQVKVPELYKGRFAMVGDAGHATAYTGTGTSLAMVGAYLLAGEIGKHPGDIAAGLKSYDERMKPIVKDLQQIPPGIPWLMAPQTAWGIWMRNRVLALIGWASSLTVMESVLSLAGRLFSSSTGVDKYNLPEYDWID